MGYDEQLSAAKFRAERDQARQECERLRARMRDSVPREAYERKRAAWLRQIRECETALHRRREHVKKLENAALERRTVREEDREAAEWVREHGGVDAISARLMPEGYEWPRYESGEPVRIGDVVSDVEVRSVVFRDGGILLSDCTSVPGWGTWRSYKEPIRRPAPKVLDADGEEIRVGDTVWTTRDLDKFTVTNPNNGNFLSVSCKGEDGEDYCCYPTDLTHRAPVLAADGRPLREGETVWDTKGNGPYIIDAIEIDGVVRIKGNDLDYFGADFTHERLDSWEKWREDSELSPIEYCVMIGYPPSEEESAELIKNRDLVRRAKKLAERGQ